MAELIDRYTYRVFWSDEDEEYVGLCAEFGLLSHLDDTPERALAGIIELVSHAVQLNLEEGVAVPEPIAIDDLGDGRLRGYSDVLGLYVCWEDGLLRFFDPATETYLYSHEEERTGRAAAEARAEQERAERLAAESRAAELEEELRRMRGE